jgi:signal transduction histidine kinase
MAPDIRVLLIDDDSDDAILIKHLLSETHDHAPEARFELRTADRLTTGCKLLSQEPFDAVLLDLVLPGGVGIESYAKLREVKADVPVVVLTGLKDEALAVKAVSLGAQDYLVKGTIDAQVLKRSIRYAIERGRLVARLESLLNADLDGKIVVDHENVVRYLNPAAQSLLGRGPDAVGRALPLELPARGCGDLRLPATGRGGEQRVVDVRCSSLDWAGQPARLVTLRDVTEMRRLELVREEVKQRMMAVDLKTEFMNTISHELRNPLTTVKTAIQSLRDGLVGPMTPAQLRFVDLAHRNVDRQIRIINNVLDIARFQSGRARLDLRRVDLGVSIDELMQGYAIAHRGPKLEAAVPAGVPEIRADSDLVTQVLANLIDNALRYARERVQVKVAPTPEGVQLSVIDDGPGMAESQAAKLFSKFVQVTRAPGSGGYKGTGLGLAICKEIMAAHGGKIWVESAPGKGARFHALWPAFAAEPENVVTRAQ